MITESKVSKFFFEIMTGTSNRSYEISRVLSLMGVLAYIVYGGFHLFVNHVFSPLEFGGGFGAILLGAGFGTAAKDRADPENAVSNTATATASGRDTVINEAEATATAKK